MPKVVTFSPGDVVRPMAQWDDPDFGTVGSQTGGGLLALNPDRPPKYAICFLQVENWEDISECYWIPIPDHVDVILSQKNAATPDNIGAIALRGKKQGWEAFSEKVESTIPFTDLIKPDTYKTKGDRLKWGKTGDAYKLTPEGEQYVTEYWDDKERGPIIGPRESGYRTSPFRDLSKKTQVSKQQALQWYSSPKTLREIVSTIGEDEFYDQKSKGYWQLVTDLAVREDPEEELTERKKRVLGIPGLGKVGEAFTPFVQGAGIAAGAGASIGASTGKQFGSGFMKGARVVGRAQMNRFADTRLGEHFGVQKRKQTQLRWVPVGQGVVFVNPIPALGIEKNQMAIVERGSRGGEKTVRFIDTGEQVMPQQGTVVMQVPPSELPTVGSSGLVGHTPFDVPTEMSYRSGQMDYNYLTQALRNLEEGSDIGYTEIDPHLVSELGEDIRIPPDKMYYNKWNPMSNDSKRRYLRYWGPVINPGRKVTGLNNDAVRLWERRMPAGPQKARVPTRGEEIRSERFDRRFGQHINLGKDTAPKPRREVRFQIVQQDGKDKLKVIVPPGAEGIPGTGIAPAGWKPYESEAKVLSIKDLQKVLSQVRGKGINLNDWDNWVFVGPEESITDDAKESLMSLIGSDEMLNLIAGGHVDPVVFDSPSPAAEAANIEYIEVNPPSREEEQENEVDIDELLRLGNIG